MGISLLERSYLTVLVLETIVLIKADTKLQLIKLNLNGSISDTSKLPTCHEGGSIDLVSYKYIKNVCSSGGYCYLKEALLSETAELLLHEMCSSRGTCIPRSFPASDLQDIGVDTIEVRYYCLDHFVTFFDLCSDTTKTVDTTIHLRSSDTLETFKECTCSITGGPFAVDVNDVRLSSGDGHGCSPADLLLPSSHYVCESYSENFGSVFNTTVSNSTSKFTVQLRTNSKKVFPQMVWIIIQPKHSITVNCKDQPWNGKETVTAVATTEASTDDSGVITAERENISIGLGVGLPVAICTLLALVILVVYLKRKRRVRNRDTELQSYSQPEEAKMLSGSSQSGLSSDDLNYNILETDVIVDSIRKEIKSIKTKVNKPKFEKPPKKYKTRDVLKSVIECRKTQDKIKTNFPI